MEFALLMLSKQVVVLISHSFIENMIAAFLQSSSGGSYSAITSEHLGSRKRFLCTTINDPIHNLHINIWRFYLSLLAIAFSLGASAVELYSTKLSSCRPFPLNIFAGSSWNRPCNRHFLGVSWLARVKLWVQCWSIFHRSAKRILPQLCEILSIN